MVNRECFTSEVLKITGKSHGEDTLWWLLIMKSGYSAFALKKPLSFYRKVEGSLSSKIMNNQTTVWHSYTHELELKKLQASFFYFLYILDVTFRRVKFHIKEMILKL